MKRKITFEHLRGVGDCKFSAEKNRHNVKWMQGIIRLEKKIGWYKLVAKTSEPKIEQKYA